MRQKLAGWKANVLSMAGRVTLVQSIRAAILVYTMQTCLLPVSLCNAMDKICRDFIWKGIHGAITFVLLIGKLFKNLKLMVDWDPKASFDESCTLGEIGMEVPVIS